MNKATLILQVLTLLAVLAGTLLIRNYLPSYAGEKGRNLATKQDIEEITRKIEAVKAEIQRNQLIEQAKRDLKYQACLEALGVIDGVFSHSLDDPRIIPQASDTARARECHNKLILSCDDVGIVRTFSEIMFGPKPGTQKTPPTDLLNQFRNLVRKELGFGQEVSLDRDRAWIGAVVGDPKPPRGKSIPTTGSSVP